MSDDFKINNIIGGVFVKNNRLANGYQQYTVERVWREVFGSVISNYTSKVSYRKGVLTVYLTSSALKQELSNTKEIVIEKMNKHLQHKKVTELVVR